MRIADLIDCKAELTHHLREDQPVVLSTRVRLARNLSRFPFPGWANASQRERVMDACFEALSSLPRLSQSTSLPLTELSDLEKQILMERRLISRELATTEEPSGAVISPDQSISVMINEEDHLRLQAYRTGFHFNALWEVVSQLDSSLEKHLDYAFSAELGYLTACPTNLGTGLRASAMMHLPGLVATGMVEKVMRSLNLAGIAVRGLHGEGSDATGAIFQISNQQTLGEDETSIIERLSFFLARVIEHELNARQRSLEEAPAKLFDKIGRSYGALRFAHVLSSEEALSHLSQLRLATDLGILDVSERARIDRLLIQSQPGHIQYLAHGGLEPEERDRLRAGHIREQLGDLSALDFTKVTQHDSQEGTPNGTNE